MALITGVVGYFTAGEITNIATSTTPTVEFKPAPFPHVPEIKTQKPSASAVDSEPSNATAPSRLPDATPPATTAPLSPSATTSKKSEMGSGGASKNIVLTHMVVTTSASLSKVTEQDVLSFKAVVHFKDGTTKDVTTEASWQVLGPVGSITANGVFTAALEPDVAEFGEGSGAIVATWQDPASGEEVLGKTYIFEVDAYVPPAIERAG
jgi:hypothetical protein